MRRRTAVANAEIGVDTAANWPSKNAGLAPPPAGPTPRAKEELYAHRLLAVRGAHPLQLSREVAQLERHLFA